MKIKTFYTASYFLYILITLGAFASMAKNNYGLPLVGYSCLLFAVITLTRIIQLKNEESIFPVGLRLSEVFLLALVAILLCLRAFYIWFPFIEIVTSLIFMLAAAVYALVLRHISAQFKRDNVNLTTSSLFYSFIILFFISLAVTPHFFMIATIIGVLAGISLISFIALAYKKTITINSEAKSLTSYLFQFKNLSTVVAFGFIMIAIYAGLNTLGVAPEMYTRSEPSKYLQMVRSSETDYEKQTSNNYQEFKERYDDFLSKYGD